MPLGDSGESHTEFGQQVIATAAIAEFGAVILLSFFFSSERPGAGTELFHLSAFLLLAVLVFLSISRGGRSARLMAALDRLREGSTQIQVRADLASSPSSSPSRARSDWSRSSPPSPSGSSAE